MGVTTTTDLVCAKNRRKSFLLLFFKKEVLALQSAFSPHAPKNARCQ
jgi:hypothetical protein